MVAGGWGLGAVAPGYGEPRCTESLIMVNRAYMKIGFPQGALIEGIWDRLPAHCWPSQVLSAPFSIYVGLL